MLRKNDFMQSFKGIIRKFTLLDILVVLLALGILGFLLTKKVVQKTEWVNVRLKLGASEWWWDTENPEYWFVAKLKKDEKAYSSLGDQVATLKNIEIYDDEEGKKVVYVTLSLAASHDDVKDLYIFNYQPLQIGKPIDLNFSGGNVRGLVIAIGKTEVDYKMKIVDIRVESVLTEIAQTYKQGLEIKDNNNNSVAFVESVKSEDSRTYQLTDVNFNRITIANTFPNRKDVTLRIQLRAFESGGEWYFVNGQALKAGQLLNLFFPETSIKDGIILRVVL